MRHFIVGQGSAQSSPEPSTETDPQDLKDLNLLWGIGSVH